MAEKKEDKVQVTPAQDFLNRYNKLVEETGHSLLVDPTFVKNENGTYSISFNVKVINRNK